MVGSAYHHSHLVGDFAVEGIVGIECPAPHLGPEVVASQTEDEFADVFIKPVVAVVRAVMVLDPGGEARGVVVEESGVTSLSV